MATEQEKQAFQETYKATLSSGGSYAEAKAAASSAVGRSPASNTGTKVTGVPASQVGSTGKNEYIRGRRNIDTAIKQATSGRMTNSGTRRQYIDNLRVRENELSQTIAGSDYNEVQDLINGYKDAATKWSSASGKQRSLEQQNPYEAAEVNTYLDEMSEFQQLMDEYQKQLEKYGISVNGASVDTSKYNQIYFDSLKGKAADTSAEYVPANGLLRDSTTLDVDNYLSHVNADEMQLYNYLAVNNPEEAESFRQYLDNLVQQRIGGERAEQILDKYTAGGRAVSRGAEAFKSGLAGAYNAVVATATGEDRKTSASEYAAEQLRADLLSKGDEWWRTAGFDAMQSIGNMAPGVVAGMINPTAGMAVFGATSGTMAYQDKLAEGWSAQDARNYGLMVGASEAALGKLMGGIPALGGMEGGLLNKLTSNVNNAIAKAVINGVGEMGSEALEEGLQTLIEPAIVSAIKGTPYDTPELREVLYSAVLGAVTAAGFNAPNTAIEAADAASAYKGRYGADAQTLVNEAKQIKDVDKALVSKAQSKLDKGKSISNNTAQQLTTTVNRSRMVDAVEAQINERASDMDAKTARSLANAVVAKSRNEGLTKNQKTLIDKNKDLAGQLAQEINPKTPADWAKRVGMRGAEARAYGDRNIVNAVEQYEQDTLTGGEYAEARADLMEKGQNRVEYTDDFDYVAEVYGNTQNYDNFDEVWDAVKDETVLTQAQARAAWEAGRSKLSLADNAIKLTRRGTGTVSFEAVTDGDVQYEPPTADEIDSFKRGARYQYLETLAKKIGVDIVFFKGGAEGINGKYLDGTVYLAIDASPSVSESVNGYVMLTAAHELTHYIREASPARYAELKDFIIKHIIDKGKVEGKTFKQLIEDKRRAYARANVELSVDNAIEEVVADACEMMLRDNTLVAQLRNENDTLYGSVSKWLKKFMRKVRTAFKGLEAHHTEARAIEDSFRELQRIWNLGLTEATQAEVTAQGEDIERYSLKSANIRRTYINYGDIAAEEKAIKATAESLVARGKYVEITEDDVKEFYGIDYSDYKKARPEFKDILREFLGESVYLSVDGKNYAAYLTKDGLNHAAVTEYSLSKAALYNKFRELIASAEYSFSSENHGHAVNQPAGTLWDNFVSVAMYKGEETVTRIVVRSVDLDVRSQIYDLVSKTKEATSSHDDLPESGDALPNYGGTVTSESTISENASESKRKLSIKDEAMSDRMLLANTLYSSAQNDGERRRLNNYKAQIDLFDEIQEQLEAAEEELSRAYRAGDKKAIAKAQKERNALTEKLIRADSKLTELQATKPLKELLSRVRQDTRRNTQRSTRERRDKSELRKKIKTLHGKMTSQLLNPKENRYVPKPLLKTVAELLDLINLDSGRSEKIKAKLAELSGQYKKIANDNNYSYVFDSDVADMIATLQGVIAEKDDTSIYHMSKDELQMVYDTMKAINHTARTAVRLIGYEENRNIFELAKAMMTETRKSNPVASKLANKYINATMRPDVFFKRMGGYVKNSVWQVMGNMLNEAQRKQTQIQMEGAAIFEELMRDTKAFDRMTNHKELIDIGLEDDKGNAVMVTRDIAMKIYMDTMAEDNARHLMSGGYTVPAMREYYKGRASEAFARGSVTIHGFGPLLSDLQHQLRHAETEAEQAEIQQKIDKAEADAAKWVENLRRNIYDQLGDYELEWIRAAEMFFNDYSQRVLNETTMAVYGFEKATVPYYVPIHTDPAYRQANFESISRDMSLENSGFMKARVEGAKNPMLAEGLVDIINGQIDKVAKYAAMMPAIRNFQKVYGKSTAGYESSVQSEVRSKFGNEALKYIENIITDLTSPRYTEGGLLGDFADRLRGNLAQAALTANPRVALEQVTSYPKAAVVVGYEPLIKAFRDIRDNPVRDQTAREEIAKWTPLMWYRMQGYFDRDIGDLRNDKQMLNKVNKKLKFITGWIEAVEGATVGQMWYAAQYYVEDTTNLERGTDEFMQETAKVFNRIVEQTQANYTMFQRPDILRNPNAIVKQLTMFMTERLQNVNMVFDAVGTYNAYLKDFRNGENDVSEDDVKQAKQTVVRTASSLIAATASSVALKLLVDMLMYSMKGYRDEDEELTMASITGQVIENFFESAAGNFLWGSELFSIMRSVITDETYYGISLGGVETFTDALNALVKTMQEPTWENWKKSIKTGMQMMGIPLNNGIKIYNAIAYRIKDVQEGNGWGSYASELKLTEEQIAKQLYNAAITDNEKRLNDLFEHYGTEAAADAALAKHIKGLYQNDELSAEEAEAQLREYASMSEYDAKLAVDKLRFEKEHGFDYNDMKQQYLDGNITDSEAVKWRTEYGDQDQSDAEKEVNQWRMKKETGFEYDKIKDYLTSGDITKQQAIEYRMEYGGQDLEDATVYITKLMGEIETGIPYDKVEDYYRDGLVSYDELVDYYMQYWSYDELKAIQVADKRKFIGTDESLADASLAAVSGYYGYCEEADVDKRIYLTAYQTCYDIRADKDANGNSISGTALKKKLAYIDGLNLQPYQKTAVAKGIGITDKQLKKYKAAWL